MAIRYGVFIFEPENRYRPENALKIYKRECAAQKACAKDPRNVVVRTVRVDDPPVERPTWHVVTSQGPTILGVFGEALLSEAQACAARIKAETGFDSYVNQMAGARPAVGQMYWRAQP